MKIKQINWLMILLLEAQLAWADQGEGFIYSDKGRRDPFISLIDNEGRYVTELGTPLAYGSLKLSGILWDPKGKSSCLVNGQILKVGDLISGFTIKAITKNNVIAVKDGKDYRLELSSERKPAKAKTDDLKGEAK